jgi:predicted HicB family RNase H-like nuclease
MAETVVHFQIRMPPSLHEHMASRAREEKTSLNALIVSLLRDAALRGPSPLYAAVPGMIPSA